MPKKGTKKRIYTKEIIEKAAGKTFSIAGLCKELNIFVGGGNYETIYRNIKKFNVDVSHFTGAGWRKGRIFLPQKPLDYYLVENCPTVISTYHLKNRCFKENIFKKECMKCKNTKWYGNIIPLELHHINGKKQDNRLENLQILCPNCHAITDNYRGKNKKRRDGGIDIHTTLKMSLS